MPKTMTVANVQDAVELAQKLKAKGQYDWFRGQVRDWPPVSSMLRVNRDGDEAAVERMLTRYVLFGNWLKENTTLSYLLEAEHTHHFFAIAQHFGIPTHYIDFTTDPAVAGFFAADTKSPPTEGTSCIYCLDTKELLSIAKSLKAIEERAATSIETIEVDVTNLWRLQAQQGVFVFSDYNWDIDFPMDRIVFPYTGYPSYPSLEHIYPKDKSGLELLLDQYFDVESKTFGHWHMRDMIAEINRNGGQATLTYAKSFEDGFYAEAFVDPGKIMPLSSWSSSRISAWQTYSSEHFDDIGGHTERIYVKAPDRPTLERAVAFGVKQVLDKKPQNREKLVTWLLEDTPSDLSSELLSRLFRSAWNGMRSLPYSNEQIAAAFSSIAGLVYVNFGNGPQPTDDLKQFAEVRGNGIRVEFAYADNSSSRGYANEEGMRSAMRDNLKHLVCPKYRNEIAEVKGTLQLIQNPALLFDFEKLVDIFARDLIPSQIVLGRKPTLFNPAALTILGLP